MSELHAVGAILDDIDSRPGSVTSLARTVLGAYVRELGGWIAIADFGGLLAALGVPEQSARTAVTRLKGKGVLDAETRGGRSGYRLTPAAEAMYARGDARIFGFRRMGEDDPWQLICFGIPESARAARHQLRRRLSAIGCGTVAPGLWICPHYLADEAAAIVTALGLDEYVTTFRATDMTVPTTPRTAAAQWWDLDGLAGRYLAFLAHHGRGFADDTAGDADAVEKRAADGAAGDRGAAAPRWVDDDERAFRIFVPLLDEWRTIPYLDPGLPERMLPPDWPGPAGVRLFATARDQCLGPSLRWVRSVVDPR
ncbi:Phenylacetic acid degradation operon negative regulatory protein paaX [Nocardia otitidiscaviarum]|uniref:Phenylacetic acid degradation operon negative regulatory protein paaX n=1 Tax=Nocardia otitidiscaviarum TaxID=1823 RepID=A0A378YRH8_9NOCA|nr:PaaX family transcriptional regulator C-terminal domain-containing protein [Nocardia otitidiscaviarum]SUA79762.1 Phenylacetic acid degradation operon negative regulatory protein paaX [Nocardia otitidiscaviarum]